MDTKKIKLHFNKPAPVDPAVPVVTARAGGGYISRLNGQYHAVGKPAILSAQGSAQWYDHGKRHRIGGAAMSSPDGTEAWYENDQRHRLNGAAETFANGTKHYCQFGQLHRDDGPAIDGPHCTPAYFLRGQTPTADEMEQILEKQKIREAREAYARAHISVLKPLRMNIKPARA